MHSFKPCAALSYEDLPALLLPWYAENARDLPWRKDREPYHIWLSEIMLQQTRVEAVRSYYLRFLEQVPGISELAALPEDRLLKLWEGLGYYSRARNLQKAARKIITEHQGIFPQTHKEILALPGIGPYTAGAIASICFDLPVPAVDGNVLRVLSRIQEYPEAIDLTPSKAAITAQLEAIYPQPEKHLPGSCGQFTQALMELGALICTPKKPKCSLCPLAGGLCKARAKDTVENFPLRSQKQEKRTEQRTVFLLQWENKIALEIREGKGLLSGLWQLPNISGTLSPAAALEQAESFGAAPMQLCRALHRTHIFTHIRWEMVCYQIRCGKATEKFTWASREDLESKYALPTAFRIFLEDPSIFSNA